MNRNWPLSTKDYSRSITPGNEATLSIATRVLVLFFSLVLLDYLLIWSYCKLSILHISRISICQNSKLDKIGLVFQEFVGPFESGFFVFYNQKIITSCEMFYRDSEFAFA